MKIKTTFLLLFLCLFLSVVGASNAFATSYYLWDDWGGTYYDAEKSSVNTEDDLMCWAASTANILTWTGWGNNIGDEDDIFSYFQDYWSDNGGHVVFGVDWWFDGTNDSQGLSGWSQVDVTGGGGFYTGYDIDDYLVWSDDTDWLMVYINLLLYNGYATSLGITNTGGTMAHAITCWGFEYDEYGYFTGIWVTDSDDSKNEENPSDLLVYYAVSFLGGKWYLQDFYYYDNYTVYLNDITGLAGMPVPEPATMLLFGVGLLGLAGRTRRKLKK